MGYAKTILKEVQTQRLVLLTSLGTLIHWYDFFTLSALLGLIMKHQIGEVSVGTNVLVLVTSFIGFLVRPLGALYFGNQMDRLGRKAFFTRSLNVMAFATLMVAILPYSWIPPWVGLTILMICRVAQGISVSMEYGAAAAYIYESVPENKTGFLTSVLQSTAFLGFLISSGAILVFQRLDGIETFQSWLWRVPLILGSPLLILTYRVRATLPESPEFEKLIQSKQVAHHTIFESLKKIGFSKLAFLTFAITAPQGLSYYYAQVFFPSYLLKRFPEMDKTAVSFVMMSFIAVLWPACLYAGRLVDRYNPRIVFRTLVGALALVLPFSFAAITQIKTSQTFWSWDYWCCLAVVYIFSLMIYGVTAKVLAEEFSPTERGLGISFPYHIGNGFFGGLMGLLAGGYFFQDDHGWYTTGVMLCALLVSVFLLVLRIDRESSNSKTIQN